MLLPKSEIAHITSVRHEGKVVVLAVDNSARVFYTIRRDGFEDAGETLDLPDWENWQQVVFPGGGRNEDVTPDQSVLDREREDLLVRRPDPGVTEPSWVRNQRGIAGDGDAFIYRARYDTHDQTAVAPIEAVSALGHLYIFRRSKDSALKVQPRTLLVDRFVLDGLSNRLVRKIEVRFKRSRMRYRPLQPQPGDKRPVFDTLEFRDTNNVEFLEPTTELSLLNLLENEPPSVVLVPTDRSDIWRWHFFNRTGDGKVQITSIRASADGLFDVSDDGSDAGVQRRTVAISPGQAAGSIAVISAPAAAKYDEQTSKRAADGRTHLLRTASRLMLAAPTRDGVASISQ